MKSTALMIMLFCNQIVFGMIVNNSQFSKVEKIKKNIIQIKKNREQQYREEQCKNKKKDEEKTKLQEPVVLNNSCLGKEVITKIFLTKEIINIILFQCSFSDRLNLRETCKYFGLYFQDIFNDTFQQIFSAYQKISFSCVFLHCVDKKKYKEVEWFLKNKEMHKPLFYIHYIYNNYFYNKQYANNYSSSDKLEYFAICPLDLIEKNDLKMQELFRAYNYNKEKFFNSLKEDQEQYGKPEILNTYLQELQQASAVKTIDEETINLKSNNLKEKLSAKEYLELELHKNLINIDCYHELILAACIGDIESFSKLIEDCNKEEYSKIYHSIYLSIVAAVKNKDLNFIQFVLKQKFYIEEINSNVRSLLNDMPSLLSGYLLNTFVEWARILNISSEKRFSSERITWIKKLIEIGMFTQMPKMIEKNKNTNEQIKEIYNKIDEKRDCEKYNKFSENNTEIQTHNKMSF